MRVDLMDGTYASSPFSYDAEDATLEYLADVEREVKAAPKDSACELDEEPGEPMIELLPRSSSPPPSDPRPSRPGAKSGERTGTGWSHSVSHPSAAGWGTRAASFCGESSRSSGFLVGSRLEVADPPGPGPGD